MTGQNREKALILTLAIALLVAALRFGGTLLGFEEIPIAHRQPAVPGKRLRTGHHEDRLAVLRLADLDHVPGISTSSRNPWNFVDPPRPAAAVFKTRTPTVVAEPPAVPPAREQDSRPDFTWRYLGRFGSPEKQIAVFTDGHQVLNRLEGGVIDGRFVVGRIGYESVDVRFVDFPDAPGKRVGVSSPR